MLDHLIDAMRILFWLVFWSASALGVDTSDIRVVTTSGLSLSGDGGLKFAMSLRVADNKAFYAAEDKTRAVFVG